MKKSLKNRTSFILKDLVEEFKERLDDEDLSKFPDLKTKIMNACIIDTKEVIEDYMQYGFEFNPELKNKFEKNYVKIMKKDWSIIFEAAGICKSEDAATKRDYQTYDFEKYFTYPDYLLETKLDIKLDSESLDDFDDLFVIYTGLLVEMYSLKYPEYRYRLSDMKSILNYTNKDIKSNEIQLDFENEISKLGVEDNKKFAIGKLGLECVNRIRLYIEFTKEKYFKKLSKNNFDNYKIRIKEVIYNILINEFKYEKEMTENIEYFKSVLSNEFRLILSKECLKKTFDIINEYIEKIKEILNK